MDVNVKWFKNYEEREEYFSRHVSVLIPPSHLGAGRFWRAFNAVCAKDVIKYNNAKTACITAFPQDSLAFASPLQVLRAAIMGREKAQDAENRAIELFKLGPLLNQALRTLSGGETVRLALAKAWLNSATHTSLAIASPYSWLDKDNAGLTETVANAYLTLGKPVEYLALNGENTDQAATVPVDLCQSLNQNPVAFEIETQNLKLKLSQSLSLGAPPVWARAGDFRLNLVSPCLVTGQNGAGKSLLVKALTKISGYRGELSVASGDNKAPCRLLQQNTLSQSLFRVGDQFAPTGCGPAYDEFSDIRQNLKRQIETFLNTEISAESVLGLKTALMAARLCQKPKLVILDEPEWGLSFKNAEAFVMAVCAVAHYRQVPVMLVSHKNWWQNLAQSQIVVSKTPPNEECGVNTAFNMLVKAV